MSTLEEEAQITISDVQGKTILKKIVRDGDGQIVNLNLDGAARGLYFVEVRQGAEHTKVKLIVQ